MPAAETGLYARVVALTDIGKKRKNNEDNYIVMPLDGNVLDKGADGLIFSLEGPGLLLAVADGMGGHQSGEVASRLCVENVGEKLMDNLAESPTQDMTSALRNAAEESHREIYEASLNDEALHGMGCTLTAAVLGRRAATLAQVGDSRAYLFRQGRLLLLTEDQTVGNLLRASDELVAAGDRVNDILTQAIGAQLSVSVAMSSRALEPYDQFLICCDGLYKAVADEDIARILGDEAPLRARAEALIEQANENGGPDNITVVTAEIRPLAGQTK